ncbi:MAG: nitrite reductase small subunit NirD [Methylococcales bacterium]|nr:nitrite reductase small subunit NirD [Methylococcales bacterium]MCK5925448.1 nitrite reductase small subunit NirD [Methylococcales bacterium]
MAQWLAVCAEEDLQTDSGVCALVDNTQVAIFYMPKDNKIYAINNYDPFSKAYVLSRGLIGDIGGEPMVSSPVYKQHFSLKTGQCFEDETIKVESYQVRIENGRVEVSLTE